MKVTEDLKSVKSYVHLCQIYPNHSPNMVMSSDPRFKFQSFYFSPNSILNFRKITNFGGNWLKNKNFTGKNKFGGAYRVKPWSVEGLELKG